MFIMSHLLNELSNVFSLLFFGKTSDAADLGFNLSVSWRPQ